MPFYCGDRVIGVRTYYDIKSNFDVSTRQRAPRKITGVRGYFWLSMNGVTFDSFDVRPSHPNQFSLSFLIGIDSGCDSIYPERANEREREVGSPSICHWSAPLVLSSSWIDEDNAVRALLLVSRWYYRPASKCVYARRNFRHAICKQERFRGR